MWIWFMLLSILFGLLVALISGSLQIKRSIQDDATLECFQAHVQERVPALMKQYRIPGCNNPLCTIMKSMDRPGYADMESGRG